MKGDRIAQSRNCKSLGSNWVWILSYGPDASDWQFLITQVRVINTSAKSCDNYETTDLICKG